MATVPAQDHPSAGAEDLLRQVRELRGAVRRLEYANLALDARIDAEDAREKVLRARLEATTADNGRLAETLGAFRHRLAARLAGPLRRCDASSSECLHPPDESAGGGQRSG